MSEGVDFLTTWSCALDLERENCTVFQKVQCQSADILLNLYIAKAQKLKL